LYPSIAKRRYQAHPIARVAGVVVARGNNTADNTLTPALSMNRTVSYSIFIVRTNTGYQAFAPAFPDLIGRGRGSRAAYAALRNLINARVMTLISSSTAPPFDPVVQSKTLRVDLWYLRQQEELQ